VTVWASSMLVLSEQYHKRYDWKERLRLSAPSSDRQILIARSLVCHAGLGRLRSPTRYFGTARHLKNVRFSRILNKYAYIPPPSIFTSALALLKLEEAEPN